VADRDRETPDRQRSAPAGGRAASGRARPAAAGGGTRAGAGERVPPGPAERVPDDLWAPYGSGSLTHLGARAHRMLQERAERGGGRDSRARNRGRARGRTAPSLSRAEIVDAAIAVADAEGSEAVSMRRIAQVLQAGTMSLYWHVANKEHLLDLMLDALIAEVEVPVPTGDWLADLRALARNERAMLLRHLWMMDFVGGRPPLGPNTMLSLDRSLALLDGVGLDIAAAVNVLSTLRTYTLGAVVREAQEMRVQRDQEQFEVDGPEWERARAAWRDRLAADGRFTNVVRFLDEGIDPDAADTRDERFEFGLDCVLDGIAQKVAALSRGDST
jgi:AcrR family transcriptional regulator